MAKFIYGKYNTITNDTSNVEFSSMYSMFGNSAATVGYARTQADANKFNSSSDRPAGLNFAVKP